MANIAVYAKERQGETVHFQVAPAHYPKNWALLAIGALLFLIAFNVGSFLVLALAGGCLWFGYTDPRPPQHNNGSMFSVTASAIESSRGTFRKSDIEQLTIRTGYTSDTVLERIGAEIGQLLKVPVDQVTGSLMLRSKGLEHTLAGGLDPRTARSLLSDVTEALAITGQPPIVPNASPIAQGTSPIEQGTSPIAQDAWDHLVLPPHIKTQLQEACAFLQNARARGSKGVPPSHVLLYGAPGTGKTEVARTMSRSGIPLVAATYADIKGSFIGQTGANLRRLFERARAIAPSVLFIDEIDAIAASRSSSESDLFSQEVVSELLVHMDDATAMASPVLILAAANYPQRIDPAVLARFRYRIEMPLPDEEARRDILKGLLRSGPLEAGLDVDDVAAAVAAQTSGCSGGDLNHLLRRAVQEAAMHASSENEVMLTRALIMQQAEQLVGSRRAPT